MLLVVFSFIVSVPLSYHFMHNWLQNYEYRTTLSLWIFAATGIGALLITFLTVSYQSIKAAIANPITTAAPIHIPHAEAFPKKGSQSRNTSP